MICTWSSWCHCHPIISCFSKIQNGLSFWCRLTQVFLEKMPLSVCVYVCELIWLKPLKYWKLTLTKYWHRPTTSLGHPSFELWLRPCLLHSSGVVETHYLLPFWFVDDTIFLVDPMWCVSLLRPCHCTAASVTSQCPCCVVLVPSCPRRVYHTRGAWCSLW